MVRATGIESNGGADEDIAIDTPAMSAAVIGDIIDALTGVLSCSREVIELAVMTLVVETRDAQGVRFGVSPRGSLNVAAMARARALMQGRDSGWRMTCARWWSRCSPIEGAPASTPDAVRPDGGGRRDRIAGRD